MNTDSRLLRECIRQLISEQYAPRRITVDGVPCAVEVADDEHSRARGLMGRATVPPGTGMLFLYPQPMRLSFWMKNTPAPLSIAFIDGGGRITEIAHLRPFSQQSVKSSSSSCIGALEVPQGWFKENDIDVGARISGLYQ